MTKTYKEPKGFNIKPNMVNYIEEDKRGLHFHYALNKPRTLYFGDAVLYRKEPKMAVIEQAWERDFYSLLELRISLDAFLALETKENFDLEIKGESVQLRHFEVMFLRKEIESVVRSMKDEPSGWEIRPEGQRVPDEHLYAVS